MAFEGDVKHKKFEKDDSDEDKEEKDELFPFDDKEEKDEVFQFEDKEEKEVVFRFEDKEEKDEMMFPFDDKEEGGEPIPKTVVVKSSNVYPNAKAPAFGLHEPIVLPDLKTRYDISEGSEGYDSDDVFGNESVFDVDPYYESEEADLWWNETEYVEKCCFDSVRVVKKVANSTALPISSEVCSSLPELPFEIQLEILDLAEVSLETVLVLSTRYYAEFYPQLQSRCFSVCHRLSHFVALGGAVLCLMSEGETVRGCLHRFMSDEIVEGDDFLDLENAFGGLGFVAHKRGLCHWRFTKEGLAEFVLKVENILTRWLANLLGRIVQEGIDDN